MLITAAVAFSVLRAVLPYATGYKQEIQQEISAQIGLPVEIQSIDAAIHWFSPRLRLIGVSVYDEKNKVPLFNFAEAFVELDVVASALRREFIVDDVGLVGVDLSIERLSDEEWMVQGIRFTSDGSDELPDSFIYILQNSDFLLQNSNIYYQDHTGDKLDLSLLDVNVDIKNTFDNHDIRFSMTLPEEYGQELTLAAELKGDYGELDGEIYIEATSVDVARWNRKFKLEDAYQIDADADIKLWVTLDNNKIKALTTQLHAADVSVKNNHTSRHWGTEFLSTRLRYQEDNKNRSIDIADFYFGKESLPEWGRTSSLSVKVSEDEYSVEADFLRLKDLYAIADLFEENEVNRIVAMCREKDLRGDIYDLVLTMPAEFERQRMLAETRLEVTLSDFSFDDRDRQLLLAGVDGRVTYVDNEAVLDMVSEDITFEYKPLFRSPLVTDVLNGEIVLALDEDGWRLSTDRLQLRNAHIDTYSRFDIHSGVDGKVWVDAQTDIYDAQGKYATRYLPVGIMSDPLIEWLDMAITDGHVAEGQFILYGALEDFPYRDDEGHFQVLFSTSDVSLKFLDDWPLLTDLSATVLFDNESLFVTDASAMTLNNRLFNGYAEIADLDVGDLKVRTEGMASNENLQAYIWKSGLDAILGDGLRLFQLGGDSVLNLDLDVPLDADDVVVTVVGDLQLKNADLYYPVMGYELTGLNGTIHFTQDSISAEEMKAKLDGQIISVKASTTGQDKSRHAVFHLDGPVSADYILQHYERIPDAWLDGTSDWSIDIELPYVATDYLAHIQAGTDLKGVAINISDAVNKPARDALALSSSIDVLEADGLYVETRLARHAKSENEKGKDYLVSFFATRDDGYRWRFDIRSDYLRGKGSFTEGLDKDTTIRLDLDYVDVYALLKTEGASSTRRLLPSEFPPLDWRARKVLWDDWEFTDVEVETGWHKFGMLINKFHLDGPAMKFDARGTWLTTWRKTHETVLHGTINSTNLGETLSGLGFERSIDRCSYEGTFDANWSAEPYNLTWENIKGSTTFKMENGEILEVNPGAGGRLLGLLNIFKLTNRLALDFDDVTREGFAFDYINGDFEFVHGDGSLKSFDVSAPAADINMFGSIGLVDRDYGLLMRVKPHTDSITFAGGTLLGGVAIGAGLALIQKVFDLSVIGHDVYSITGSWDDPKIEKIVEKDAATNEEDDDEDF